MTEDDVDDIFKDFEDKVEDKKRTTKHHVHHERHHEKKLSEDELIKERYQKAEHALKEKYRKEKEDLEKKKTEEMLKHGKVPQKLPNFERIGYIAIIAVLVIFIIIDLFIIDLSFYHGKDVDIESGQDISVTVGEEENETDETTTTTTLPQEGELELSGEITLTLAQTSPSNDYLSSIQTLDELSGTGVVPVLIQDNSGRSKYVSGFAWIRRPPDAEFGKEISNREWVLDCADISFFTGGNPDAE